jgi:hypothetical protein
MTMFIKSIIHEPTFGLWLAERSQQSDIEIMITADLPVIMTPQAAFSLFTLKGTNGV